MYNVKMGRGINEEELSPQFIIENIETARNLYNALTVTYCLPLPP